MQAVEIKLKGRDIPLKATRFGYGEGLVELGKKHDNVVVLGGDLTSSTSASLFKDAFPERFFSIGIAEQNMAGIASGLSLAGKIPFISTYCVFSAGRAWDQLRTTIAYSELNVKVGGAHSGVSVGPDGATHQGLEDVATTRCLPNLTVTVPCDAIETKKCTIALGEKKGPCYIRFGREPMPVITTEDTPFVLGEAIQFRKGTDCTIIACGYMVYRSLVAAEELESENLKIGVINLHTIKPIDKEAIIIACKESGCIVTAEEHQVMGGMGSAVAEIIVENSPVPVEMIGVLDRFGESGQPEELMDEFNLGVKDIKEAIKRVIQRKKK
ncbi:MAG: transketolase C-terminal domain-containing protein [Planctomycetota bacterium]